MRSPVSLKVAASVAALLLVVCTASNAQVYYGTDFDSGTDTVNNAPSAANYNVYTASSPTNPLDNLNGWASNDGTTTTGTSGTSTQLVGRSDFVGPVGSFFGSTNAGALGGVYRTAGGTALAPDVVPSTNSGGIVTLYHPVSITPAAGMYALSIDFVLGGPGSFATTLDSFGFTLGSASGNLLTLNFTPGIDAGTDAVGYTIGTTTNTTTSGLTLNTQYHLKLVINTAGSGTFSATFTGTGTGSLGLSGSLTGSTIAATAVNQVGVLWNLANKTATSGAYQSAGSNFIAFDNVNLAVPEPSIDALLALGLAGLVGGLCLRRRQA